MEQQVPAERAAALLESDVSIDPCRDRDTRAMVVYLAVMESAGPSFLPVLLDLLDNGCCSRCCMRFAGFRGRPTKNPYARETPAKHVLQYEITTQMQEAEQRLAAQKRSLAVSQAQTEQLPPSPSTALASSDREPRTGPAVDPPPVSAFCRYGSVESGLAAEAELRPAPQHVQELPGVGSALNGKRKLDSEATVNLQEQQRQKTAKQLELNPARGPPTQASTLTPEPTCCLCLGVLQSISGVFASTRIAPQQILDTLPDPPATGSHWHSLRKVSGLEIWQAVRNEGHNGKSIAVEVSVPASVVVRQLAMLQYMRGRHPAHYDRTSTSLKVDTIIEVKDAVKQALGSKVNEMACKPLSQDGDLRISFLYLHPESGGEVDFLFGGKPAKANRNRNRKAGGKSFVLGRAASEKVSELAKGLSAEQLGAHMRVPPVAPVEKPYFAMHSRCEVVYIGGYYTKSSRNVSHSPYFIDGSRKGVTSVEEELNRFLQPVLEYASSTFISAGREDLDVKMLGRGRPFVLQLANCHNPRPTNDQLAAVQAKMIEANNSVLATELQMIDKELLAKLKEGSKTSKSPIEPCAGYRARPLQKWCRSLQAVRSSSWHSILLSALHIGMTAYVVNVQALCLCTQSCQNHHLSILFEDHSRAHLERKRSIYTMQCEAVDGLDNMCILHLRTQAGTYIKEFVHGDSGRTKPSVGDLLGEGQHAVCLELDVTEIHMQWLTKPSQSNIATPRTEWAGAA